MSEFEINGIMMDPARLIEARSVYRNLIPLFSEWGYNTLFWHFTDDQGCALRFPSHPELASRNAYTPSEMQTLIRQATRYGINVIPEVECLGHTRYITGVKRYAHLKDGVEGKMYGAIAPMHKESQAILADLFADTARIFPSEYIHAGLDEVGFGEHPHTRKLLKSMTKYEIYAEHVKWAHSVITGLGRKMMIWADHLLPRPELSFLDHEAHSEKILDLIPKDIVVCDWHYESKPSPRTVDFLLDKGFKVVACPAVTCWETINHTRGDYGVRNLWNFSEIARSRREQGVVGMISTAWCPWRHFTGPLLYGMALGASLQRTGDVDENELRNRFARNTFGLSDTKSVAKALEILHSTTPGLWPFVRFAPLAKWEIAETKPEDIQACLKGEEGAAEALKLLDGAREHVRRNAVFFDEIRFAAKCCISVCGRARRFATLLTLVEEGRRLVKQKESAKARKVFGELRDLLRQEAVDARAIYREAVVKWRKTRFADDPKRDGRLKKHRQFDSLMQRLRVSADFIARISRQAERLARTGRGPFSLPDFSSMKLEAGL